MAETPETNKPDFTNGFPIRDLGDGRNRQGSKGNTDDNKTDSRERYGRGTREWDNAI